MSTCRPVVLVTVKTPWASTVYSTCPMYCIVVGPAGMSLEKRIRTLCPESCTVLGSMAAGASAAESSKPSQ